MTEFLSFLAILLVFLFVMKVLVIRESKRTQPPRRAGRDLKDDDSPQQPSL